MDGSIRKNGHVIQDCQMNNPLRKGIEAAGVFYGVALY